MLISARAERRSSEHKLVVEVGSLYFFELLTHSWYNNADNNMVIGKTNHNKIQGR
ncbi:MAG: hypothetical protein ABRQ27_08555 [Clostridiaceae bacterium]